MANVRPATSKARGPCKHHGTPRGCPNGKTCKFLHGDEKLTPFDKAKVCKHYLAGFCKNGDKCWFVHESPSASQSGGTRPVADQSDAAEDMCSICYEKPKTYGLLGGCSHVFCVTCIKEWRDPRGKSEDILSSGITKKCPVCRVESRFVTPSSHFYPEGHASKKSAVERYKASMARQPCKYFQKSSPRKRYCPFGKDCFYQHLNPDGTKYEFKNGVERSIQSNQYQRLQNMLHSDNARTRSSSNQIPPAGFTQLDALIADIRALHDLVSEASEMSTAGNHDPFIFDGEHSAVIEQPQENAFARLDESVTLTPSSEEEYEYFNDLHPGQEMFVGSIINWLPSIDATFTDLHDATQDRRPASNYAIPILADEVMDEEELYTPNIRPSSSGVAPEPYASNHDRDTPLLNYDNTSVDENNAYEERSSSAITLTAPAVYSSPSELPPPEQCPLENVAELPAAPIDSGTVESMGQGQTDCCTASTRAIVLHDTDPPFMTDGRGRVVWSSTTTTRPRKSRSAAVAAPLPADKAREAHAMDAHQNNPCPLAIPTTNSSPLRSSGSLPFLS